MFGECLNLLTSKIINLFNNNVYNILYILQNASHYLQIKSDISKVGNKGYKFF